MGAPTRAVHFGSHRQIVLATIVYREPLCVSVQLALVQFSCTDWGLSLFTSSFHVLCRSFFSDQRIDGRCVRSDASVCERQQMAAPACSVVQNAGSPSDCCLVLERLCNSFVIFPIPGEIFALSRSFSRKFTLLSYLPSWCFGSGILSSYLLFLLLSLTLSSFFSIS
jgi:hypothetical protein